MASKTIATILNLKDNMSGGLLKVSKNINEMSKEAKKATLQVSRMADNLKKSFEKIGDKTVKFGLATGALIGGMAVKGGLTEGMNLEGYKMQLETATKDTEKAADIMRYSIDLANRTPYEGGELVEGAAKLESMGMSAKQWLPKIGDMAAATNKSFDQANEAFIDAQTGELERLKEFGIKKMDIAKKANEMFAGQEVINQQGQITDFDKFNQALVAIMDEKFTGGMEKQATTLRGTWSTVTGVVKSSLSSMVGMSTDGTIKSGSMMDKLKEKITSVAETIQEWQNNGTLDAIAEKFTDVFTKIYDVVSTTIGFIVDHKDTFEFFGVLFAGFYVGIKVAKGLEIAFLGLEVAWGLLSGAFSISPLGWVVIVIAAIIVAGYELWKNWDWIKQKAIELWDTISNCFMWIVNCISDAWNGAIDSTFSFFSWLGSCISDGFNSALDSVSNFFEWVINGISNFFQWAWNCVSTGFMTVLNIIKVIVTPIARFFEAVFKLILSVIIIVGALIYQKFMQVWDAIYNFLAPIMAAVGHVIINTWNSIYNAISNFLQWIWNIIVSVWTSISDSISNFMQWIWNNITSAWNSIYDSISNCLQWIWNGIVDVWNNIWDSICNFVEWIGNSISDGFTSAKDGVIGIFTDMKETCLGVFGGIWDGIKWIINGGINMINGFIGKVNGVIEKANNIPGVNIGTVSEIPTFSTGTQYFKGGLAEIGEHGGEIVNLPNGSQVIPSGKTDMLLKGGNGGVSVNVNIQGNVIGNSQYADYIANTIVKKIKMNQANYA